MKLELRKNFLGEKRNALSGSVLWLIPTMMYMFIKFSGMMIQEREWVWWVLIPVMFIAWFSITWKFVKK